MTTRFLTAFVLAVCLGGIACATKTDYKTWHPRCHFCGKVWTEHNLEQGYVTNDIRLHIDDCRRLQRVKDTKIKVSPKLDSLP
jgi:hypothetical protein